jgi:hypothetical protein
MDGSAQALVEAALPVAQASERNAPVIQHALDGPAALLANIEFHWLSYEHMRMNKKIISTQ